MKKLRNVLLVLLALSFGVPALSASAWAQSDDEDEDGEEAKRERRDDGDDEVEGILAEAESRRRRRIIKVVQPKFFLKYQRLEATPFLAVMPSDFFLTRFIVGANIAYHISEIFSVEFMAAYSPNLGEADKKRLFSRLLTEAQIQADISRIILLFQMDMGISPIYGKVEFGKRIINYDIYLLVGGGVLWTHDDEEIAKGDQPGEEEYEPYLKQWHPSANFGFGFRVAFNEWFAVRLEGRWTFHVEQVVLDELALELKNNFSLTLGFSFFLPPNIENR